MTQVLVGMAAVLFCNVAAESVAQPLRLGIVSEAPELLAVADLATAELTKDGSVALVERADLSRILKEQALSAKQSTNYVKMGQLLGADGLLLLQLLTEDTNRIVVARLIAVKPGVVLGMAQSPFPIEDTTDWGAVMIARFKPLFPKLGVLPKDAVPVSLLNVRAAATGPDTSELERQLTALLVLRLMGERDLFVLERQRMESLTWEKSLKGVDETAFWTGSYLLDGALDRDGTRPGQVTVHLRLVPPKGGPPIVIPAEGKRDKPGEVIEKLIPRILEALSKRTVAPAWNADQEATKYLEEAKWAHRWGMYREAQLACEAAWALGLRTRETAGLHVQAYALAIQSDRGIPMYFGPRLTFPKPPNRAALPPAELALEHYLVHTRTLKTNTLDEAWGGLGASVLTRTGQVLEHFQRRPADRNGVEDKLADLRRLARDVVNMMRATPTLKEHGEAALVGSGTYFQETLADAVQLHRDLILSGVYRRHVAAVPVSFWHPPEPGGWGPDDWNEGRKTWQAFLAELGASDQPAASLEALLWRVARADNDYELEESVSAFLDAAWKHRDLIFSQQIPPPLWKTYEYLALDKRFDTEGGSPVRLRLRDQVVKPFNQRFADARVAHSTANAQRLALMAALRKEVSSEPTLSATEFFREFGLVRPTEAEAKEILPLLVAHQKKLGKSGAMLGGVVLTFRVAAKDPAVVPRGPSRQPAGNVTPRPTPRPPAASPTPPAATPPAAPALTQLTVNRFWKLPPTSAKDAHRKLGGISGLAFHADRLGIQIHFEDVPLAIPVDQLTSRWLGTAIHLLDPKTQADEFIEVPRPQTMTSEGGWWDDRSIALFHFVPHGDWLFVRTSDGVRKYDLKRRRWSERPLDLPADGILAATGGELFCVSSGSILKLAPDTDETSVLASCRRRPALTRLDELDRFENPVLFRDDARRLCALVGDDLYALRPAGGDWDLLGRGLGVSRRHALPPQTGRLTLRLGDWNQHSLKVWQGIVPAGAAAGANLTRHLLSVKPGEDLYWLPASPTSKPGPPAAPLNLTANLTGVWDGADFWAAVGVPTPSLKPWEKNNPAATQLLLLHYRKGNGVPLVLAPVFASPPEDQLQPVSPPAFSSWFPTVHLAISPDFMAIASWGFPGVWLIPRSDLTRQLEAAGAAHSTWKSAQSATAAKPQAGSSRPATTLDPAKVQRETRAQRKFARKLRQQNKLAPILGPLPMFKDDSLGVRFAGVGLVLILAGSISAVLFRRNTWTVLLLLAGLAGWAAIGLWY